MTMSHTDDADAGPEVEDGFPIDVFDVDAFRLTRGAVLVSDGASMARFFSIGAFVFGPGAGVAVFGSV